MEQTSKIRKVTEDVSEGMNMRQSAEPSEKLLCKSPQ